MLLRALHSGTDEELAASMDVSLPTVKKMWLSVYRRVAKTLPALGTDDAEPDASTRRGKEKKRRLLAYLREHLEELRPHAPHLLPRTTPAPSSKPVSRRAARRN